MKAVKSKFINTYYICGLDLHNGHTYFDVKFYEAPPQINKGEELRAKFNYNTNNWNFIVCKKKDHYYSEHIARYYRVMYIVKSDVYENREQIFSDGVW